MVRRKELAAMVVVVVAAMAAARVAEPRPPVATEFKLEGHQVVLPGAIVFTGETAELEAGKSEAALYHLLDYLAAKPAITLLRIEGHVGMGDGEAAQALSEARALAVGKWLVAHGADCKRLIVVGFGKSKPVAAEGAGENTRIVAVNAQLRGRAIGGLPTDGGGKGAGSVCE